MSYDDERVMRGHRPTSELEWSSASLDRRIRLDKIPLMSDADLASLKLELRNITISLKDQAELIPTDDLDWKRRLRHKQRVTGVFATACGLEFKARRDVITLAGLEERQEALEGKREERRQRAEQRKQRTQKTDALTAQILKGGVELTSVEAKILHDLVECEMGSERFFALVAQARRAAACLFRGVRDGEAS